MNFIDSGILPDHVLKIRSGHNSKFNLRLKCGSR